MGAKQNRNPWGTRTRLQIPNLPVAGAPHRPNRLGRRRGSCSGRPRWAGTVVSTSCRRSGGTSTGSTTRRRSASTRPRPPARTSSSARPPAAASPTPASSRSAATGASRPTRPPLPVPRLRPPPPPGPRIRSPRRGPHPVPPGPRFHPPSPPTETISTSSPAAVGPPTSPRLPPLAAGGARLGRGSLRQTLSQTLRSVRRRRRLGRRGLTTRSTSWVTALPGRVWRCPGTCRSLWLPPPRRGEITPKATGRRGVEGRRVSRSLERRGGRGRPRRRSVSEPCLPLQQGRRGSRTGDTRRGMCVDDARVCVILSAGSAMDVYWRKPKMGVTNLHENILKDNCGGKKQCCSGVIG